MSTSTEISVVVMVLGIVSAFAGLVKFPDLKSKTLKGILIVAILAQIATQGVQCQVATTNLAKARVEDDRNFAHSLHAFSQSDVKLLSLFADHYTVGYRHYRNKEWKEALQRFRLSIESERFVAPSHYLIAHIIRTHPELNIDLSEAVDHIEKAIAADPQYGSPYYARAIMKLDANQKENAFKDLEIALRLGKPQCYDLLNNPQEVRGVWGKFDVDPFFGPKLRERIEECRATHGLPKPDVALAAAIASDAAATEAPTSDATVGVASQTKDAAASR